MKEEGNQGMGREGTNKTPHLLTEQPAMRPISGWNALSGKEEIRFNHIIRFCSKKKKKQTFFVINILYADRFFKK